MWNVVKSNDSKIKSLKQRVEILEGVGVPTSLSHSLVELRKNISEMEVAFKSDTMFQTLFSYDSSDPLLTETSVRLIQSSLKQFNKKLQSLSKTNDSLTSVLDLARKKDLGEIRQNLCLAKIRKHYISLEKTRAPLDNLISDLEEMISVVESESRGSFKTALTHVLRQKKEMNDRLSRTSEISDMISHYQTEIEKFTALMDFVATNGDTPFSTDRPTSHNFINFAKNTKMGYLEND